MASKNRENCPKASEDTSKRINLEGKNTGATFLLQGGTGGESNDCCCIINIYINNNIQGANNSILHKSGIKMRDPGVCLFFGDVKLGKRSLRSNKKRKKSKASKSSAKLASCTILLFFFMSILLLVSLLSIWKWLGSWNSFYYWIQL